MMQAWIIAGSLTGLVGLRILGRYSYLYFCNNPDRTQTLTEEHKQKQQELIEKIWKTVDNSFYDSQSHEWWDKTASFSSGLHAMTKLRASYFIGRSNDALSWSMDDKSNKEIHIVDVGCGGGVLAEGMVRCAAREYGYKRITLTGIDLAKGAIQVAQEHSESLKKELLNEGVHVTFNYIVGDACTLSNYVDSQSADIVVAADVLEHVLDAPTVVQHISNILKPNGTFLFDTINRTFFSYVTSIFLAQELPFGLSLLPSHTHQWGLFITPKEVDEICKSSGLCLKEIKGFRPQLGLSTLKGILSRSELHKVDFTLTNNTQAQYIGIAQKQ
eukprot:CAMPEP_0206163344 /NCGR_PEP_ID=MMETSP1474-20131121/11356_1 /ASSEMBLY_ACC=CAM_ASM_001110 /TAXON_ID=97495 /ORGANISM="Imantonia sp., Strain RCC918" /LENGTH=328 /DNA_ID=CAMNT_0053565825 /DNA_START=1 /DNA_END=987 /DNA_ORIENTATION=-